MSSRTSRIRLFLPATLFVLACLIYTGYWFYTAHTLKDRLNDWAQSERAQGREVGWQTLDMGGFPFRFHLTATDISYQREGERGQLTWRAEKVSAFAQSYAPNHVLFFAPGHHELIFLPHDGSASQHYEIVAEKAEASIIGSGAYRFERLVAEVGTLDVKLHGEDYANAKRIVLQAEASPRSDTPQSDTDPAKDSLLVGFWADDVFLQGGVSSSLAPVLPPEILHIDARGIFDDRLLSGKLLSLAEWRRWAVAGGTLKLHDARIQWPPVDITIQGFLGLDSQERLEGDLNTHIGGYDALIEALIVSERIGPRTGRLIKIGLNALAMGGADEEGRLPAPLRLTRGEIYLGPLNVGDIKDIIWRED